MEGGRGEGGAGDRNEGRTAGKDRGGRARKSRRSPRAAAQMSRRGGRRPLAPRPRTRGLGRAAVVRGAVLVEREEQLVVVAAQRRRGAAVLVLELRAGDQGRVGVSAGRGEEVTIRAMRCAVPHLQRGRDVAPGAVRVRRRVAAALGDGAVEAEEVHLLAREHRWLLDAPALGADEPRVACVPLLHRGAGVAGLELVDRQERRRQAGLGIDDPVRRGARLGGHDFGEPEACLRRWPHHPVDVGEEAARGGQVRGRGAERGRLGELHAAGAPSERARGSGAPCRAGERRNV